MHMSDALISPTVAGVMGMISVASLIWAVRKVRESKVDNIVPLMGVMGAFVFAAQMINFTIPGTGSSGHIVGGILLASLLGPWAALIVLASVLTIQCLVFADGGLLALGCNLFNMAVCTCLIAYPLVYRPLAGSHLTTGRIVWASTLACVVGLLLGAFAVTLETTASGITALPFGDFLLFMLPIHLLIGIGEGLATAAVLCFVHKYKPELLVQRLESSRSRSHLWVFSIGALLMAATFGWVASTHPDGLEWSVQQVTGQEEVATTGNTVSGIAESIQHHTALMPDYDHALAGIAGALLVVLLVGVFSLVLSRHRVKAA